MEKTINIGTVINIPDLIESRMLIQANSGGGKSGIARVMMEESCGKVPFIVLDKKGEYYTLKEIFPDIIIIGGRNGDIPISMQAARLLAKFIIGHHLTVVIDMSGMESDEQRAEFIRDFLKGMMNLGEDYWTQYLVFIEEAHLFCGQQDKMPSGKYVKNLMSEGRKMGYCGILITQRISKLHKDAAAECNNKFIGRTFLDIDLQRSGAEMGLTGQEKFKLRDLKPRHFWAFGTSIEPHHVHEVVIKEAQTKFPKAGALINLSLKKPTEKIKGALAKLNELPQEAKKELKNLQDLQAEVARLTVELRKAGKMPAAAQASSPLNTDQLQKAKDENWALRVVIKEHERDIMHWRSLAYSLRDRLTIVRNHIPEQVLDIKEREITKADFKPGGAVPKTTNGVPKGEAIVSLKPTNVSKKQDIVSPALTPKYDPTLSPGERTILTACAEHESGCTRTQLTILTGYARSTRNKYLQFLQAKGFIEQNSERVYATETGIQALGDFEPLPKGEALREHWLKNIAQGEAAILRVIIEGYPEHVDREYISERTSLARSTRNKYLQYLTAREIVTSNSEGVRAADTLFDFNDRASRL